MKEEAKTANPPFYFEEFSLLFLTLPWQVCVSVFCDIAWHLHTMVPLPMIPAGPEPVQAGHRLNLDYSGYPRQPALIGGEKKIN